jgi:hypothetical protein
MGRLKKLDDLAEEWTEPLLKRSRFNSIQNLNEIKRNYPGVDFLAEREGLRYAIGSEG